MKPGFLWPCLPRPTAAIRACLPPAPSPQQPPSPQGCSPCPRLPPQCTASSVWGRAVFAKWPASCWTARGDALGCPGLLEFSVLYLLGVSIKLEEVIL